MATPRAFRRGITSPLALCSALVVLGTAGLAGPSGTTAAASDPSAAAADRSEQVLGARDTTWDTSVGVQVTTTMTDPDDPDHADGPLDLESVRHRIVQVAPHRVQLTYRLRTVAPFRDGLLADPDRVFIIELHREGTRGADRNITVSSERGELVATLVSNATREPIASVTATRVDARTLRLIGPRRLIGARSYFVYSNFHQGGSGDCGWRNGWPVTCQDPVPNDGWIRVNRLGWPDSDD